MQSDTSTNVAVSTDAASGALVSERMGVRVGNLKLLVPWDRANEVMPPVAASRLPNTASWFHGLINVRGALMPVVDTAAAFGVARAPEVPVYFLLVGRGDVAMGLMIDGLPSPVNIGSATPLPEVPHCPAMLQDSIVGAYTHADQIWMEVNLEVLFESLGRHIVV